MSEDKQAAEPPTKTQKVECDNSWEKFSIVAPQHELLQKYFVGNFVYKVEFFIEGKDEPMVSGGTSSYKPILGGRYVEATYNGKADFGPIAYEGKEILGYDL